LATKRQRPDQPKPNLLFDYLIVHIEQQIKLAEGRGDNQYAEKLKEMLCRHKQ